MRGRRGLGILGRAEAEVIEDLLDGDLVVEVRNDLELPPALATRERVGMEDRAFSSAEAFLVASGGFTPPEALVESSSRSRGRLLTMRRAQLALQERPGKVVVTSGGRSRRGKD